MPTVGVAVTLPEPWGSRLRGYRASLGDPQASEVPSHITLVPPTEVDRPLEELEEHLADAAGDVPGFEVHLRGTATFRPVSPVVYVDLALGTEGCARLADAVRRGPLDVDLAFPYHPHVTVAHHLDDATLDRAEVDLAQFDCRFAVTAFQLYVHEGDDGWRTAREFDLAVPATAGG
ncbi:MAG: 2'-5' RNA ligase [Nocardioides sp.]|nr:2'-5' RNA ligase [Nocardioides sp.]